MTITDLNILRVLEHDTARRIAARIHIGDIISGNFGDRTGDHVIEEDPRLRETGQGDVRDADATERAINRAKVICGANSGCSR